ncbi:unnamed protein product, partial [Urochloa humidicola]
GEHRRRPLAAVPPVLANEDERGGEDHRVVLGLASYVLHSSTGSKSEGDLQGCGASKGGSRSGGAPPPRSDPARSWSWRKGFIAAVPAIAASLLRAR